MKTFLFALFAVALLPAARPANAQNAQAPQKPDPINAERPGFTNGTATVAPHRIQFEAGFLYSDTIDGYENRFGDGAILRFGTNARTEVRVGLPTYFSSHLFLIHIASGDGISSSSDSDNSHGFGDTSLSAKWRFLDGTKKHPSLALIAQTTFPTGEANYRASHLQPQAALEVGYDLSDAWSVQSDLVYTRASDGGQQYNQFAGGLNFGRSLTANTAVFLETYRIAPTGAKAASGNYIDGGITYIYKNNTQFDINLGTGVGSSIKNDSFVGAGVAHRW